MGAGPEHPRIHSNQISASFVTMVTAVQGQVVAMVTRGG